MLDIIWVFKRASPGTLLPKSEGDSSTLEDASCPALSCSVLPGWESQSHILSLSGPERLGGREGASEEVLQGSWRGGRR